MAADVSHYKLYLFILFRLECQDAALVLTNVAGTGDVPSKYLPAAIENNSRVC